EGPVTTATLLGQQPVLSLGGQPQSRSCTAECPPAALCQADRDEAGGGRRREKFAYPPFRHDGRLEWQPALSASRLPYFSPDRDKSRRIATTPVNTASACEPLQFCRESTFGVRRRAVIRNRGCMVRISVGTP